MNRTGSDEEELEPAQQEEEAKGRGKETKEVDRAVAAAAGEVASAQMDLLGEIVEHETVVPEAPVGPTPPGQAGITRGFPTARAKRPSRWRQRLQEKGLSSMSGSVGSGGVAEAAPESDGKIYTTAPDTGLKHFKSKGDRKLDYSGLSEVEQIHQENIEILAHMSVAEREDAKQELLDNLDPKVLQMLMRRSVHKYGPPPAAGSEPAAETKDPLYEPVEGSMGTWVGGEHELDRQSRQQFQRGEEKRSTSNTSLKSALKTPLTTPHNSTLEVDAADDGENEARKEKAKRIRFSKEAKVIYLDQKEKVRHSSPSDSDGEWEDFEEVSEDANLRPAVANGASRVAVDDDAPVPIEDAVRLKRSPNDELADPSSSSGVHFPQPTQPYEVLDINDPQFNEKLHEKYFPDLPRNPKQLEWMKSDSPGDIPPVISYDSLESVRFDFKADLITSENIGQYINENQGLYNHAQNPELPGYTIPELAHYLRSTFPGQVCIACRTLGRLLYKLGTLQYQVHEIGDDEKINETGEEGMFEIECWKLIIKLKIIDLLQMYASDKEKNLSVKNYAIDSLWLWKQGNGDEKIKKYASQSEQEQEQ